MLIGYFLSCEEHPPEELVRQARLAADAGFEGLWISDHFHPWNHEQGQSPFVWSVIGAVSQVSDLPVTTAVTCPTVRVHPAIIAQAAATSARLCRGGFRLGVGSGESPERARDREPMADRRRASGDARGGRRGDSALLTGERVTHHGTHYTVEDARIFTLPDGPIEIPVSAFGPDAHRARGPHRRRLRHRAARRRRPRGAPGPWRVRRRHGGRQGVLGSRPGPGAGARPPTLGQPGRPR